MAQRNQTPHKPLINLEFNDSEVLEAGIYGHKFTVLGLDFCGGMPAVLG